MHFFVFLVVVGLSAGERTRLEATLGRNLFSIKFDCAETDSFSLRNSPKGRRFEFLFYLIAVVVFSASETARFYHCPYYLPKGPSF